MAAKVAALKAMESGLSYAWMIWLPSWTNNINKQSWPILRMLMLKCL